MNGLQIDLVSIAQYTESTQLRACVHLRIQYVLLDARLLLCSLRALVSCAVLRRSVFTLVFRGWVCDLLQFGCALVYSYKIRDTHTVVRDRGSIE